MIQGHPDAVRPGPLSDAASTDSGDVRDNRTTELITGRIVCDRRLTASTMAPNGNVMIGRQSVLTPLALVAVCLCLSRQETQAQDPVYHAGDHFGRLAFAPEGDRLADGSPAGSIRIWDLKTRDIVSTLNLSERRVPKYVVWSPDGKQIAVAGFGMPTEIIDVASGQREARLQKTRKLQPGNVNGLSWHPDGDSLFVSFPRTVVHWKPAQSNIPDAVVETSKKFFGWHGMLNAPGNRFALVDEHGRFRLWDVETRMLLIERDYKPCCQVYVAWPPDDSIVAISSGARVNLLDPQSGEVLRRISSPDDSSMIA